MPFQTFQFLETEEVYNILVNCIEYNILLSLFMISKLRKVLLCGRQDNTQINGRLFVVLYYCNIRVNFLFWYVL